MDKLRRAKYLTSKYGRYQKCGDIQTDVKQGENPGQTDGQGYTRPRMRRTKNPLLCGFPYATETTGVTGVIELAIYLSH